MKSIGRITEEIVKKFARWSYHTSWTSDNYSV